MQNQDDLSYQTEVLYEDHYFSHLSPAYLNFIALTKRYETYNLNLSFNYLELGCGFAHSTIIHAALYPHAQFYACDMHPEQMQKAAAIIDQLQLTNIHIYPMTFEELLKQDLPHMNFIIAHGIYSWVNCNIRSQIKSIIDQCLKPHGIAYISYNCEPGTTHMKSIREMVLEFSQLERGTNFERAQKALVRFKTMKNDMKHFQNSQSTDQLIATFEQSPRYMYGELFNPIWDSLRSKDVIQSMQDIGLSFIGDAASSNNIVSQLLQPGLKQHYASLESTEQKEFFLDYAYNRSFRRDIYIKEATVIPKSTLTEKFRKVVVGVKEPHQKNINLNVLQGSAAFREKQQHEILQILQEKPLSIGEVCDQLTTSTIEEKDCITSLIILTLINDLRRLDKAPDTKNDALKLSCLNKKILAIALERGEGRALINTKKATGTYLNYEFLFILNEWLEHQPHAEEIALKMEEDIKKHPERYAFTKQNTFQENEIKLFALDIVKKCIYNLIPDMKYMGFFDN